MTREMLKNPLREAVFYQFDRKCAICAYDLAHGLKVHHIVPVEFGGKDELNNLALLCANCHSLVHYYGAKRFSNHDLSEHVRLELPVDAIAVLEKLTGAIHQARAHIEQNGGLLDQPHSWKEALDLVASRNHYDDYKRQLFMTSITEVVGHMPPNVRSRCSFRLLGGGKYISINLMNYLLFRVPAYWDTAKKKPIYECHFSTLPKSRLGLWAKEKDRITFNFAYFEAINVGLFYEELLEFSEEDWNAFAEACILALNARRQREWPTNIALPIDLLT